MSGTPEKPRQCSLAEKKLLLVWGFWWFPRRNGMEGRLGAQAGYGCEAVRKAVKHLSQETA